MKKFLALLLSAIICFSLVACNKDPDETKTPDATETPTVQTTGDVEITKDNFDKYFEFVDESFFTKDSSGKYSQLRFRQYYKLRDGFNIDLAKSSIKLTYGYSYVNHKVSIDFENQKFTLGDQIGEKKSISNVVISHISQMTYKDCAILLYQPTHAEKGATEIECFSDIKLENVTGTLHLVEKAETPKHDHSAEDHTH